MKRGDVGVPRTGTPGALGDPDQPASGTGVPAIADDDVLREQSADDSNLRPPAAAPGNTRAASPAAG